MRRLIWGFAGRTYHIVGNLMHWLNSKSPQKRNRPHYFGNSRLQYASTALLLRFRYATAELATVALSLLFCGAWDFPRRFCYDPTTTITRHIYPCLVLVQPRKTRPCLTEILLMVRKESNKTKQNYAKATLMTLQLRPCFDQGDGATLSLRSYIPSIKSETQLIYVQLNVNIQRKWIDALKSICFRWLLWTTDYHVGW